VVIGFLDKCPLKLMTHPPGAALVTRGAYVVFDLHLHERS
jgi:hypothetical protein